MTNTILLLLTQLNSDKILINAADIYLVVISDDCTKVKYRTYNGVYDVEKVLETPKQIYDQINQLRKLEQLQIHGLRV